MAKTVTPETREACNRAAWKTAGICAALVVMVFIVFGQTVHFGFINRDDPDYTYNNPMVQRGLSFEGTGWAFTHVVSQHWHPLTVIVMMLEHQLFGLWPGGYHLVNVLLHAATVVLLFLMLRQMTGAQWRSAFVAAIFAVHPLRAESVAWIAECKDVLSGVFFMLTLWAYVRYTRGSTRGRYAAMMIWFLLGLLSKPMLVTVPCVLLLLDYWPLGRLRNLSQLPALLWEKVPLFILSALSSIATVIALKSGHGPTMTYPANPPIAYLSYLEKLFYPRRLAMLYPLPDDGLPPWQILDAVLILAALTAVVLIFRRAKPYLLTGWFWFLGMLAPVVGILQTGNQSFADRYTYLPGIGICIAVTWLVADWADKLRYRQAIVGGAAGVTLAILMALCWRQVGYWRDSITAWTRVVECTTDNFYPHMNLGELYAAQGRTEEAIAECRAALRLYPGNVEANDNLGTLLLQQGQVGEAIEHYRAALQTDPTDANVHNNLGNALARLGRFQEAAAEFRAALNTNPMLAIVQSNLGNALFHMGHAAEAIAECQAALRINPSSVDAANTLAWILATADEQDLRDGPRAAELAAAANQATGGNNPAILRTLAAAQAQNGDFAGALQTARRALAAAPSGSSLADALRGDIALYQSGRRIEDGAAGK